MNWQARQSTRLGGVLAIRAVVGHLLDKPEHWVWRLSKGPKENFRARFETVWEGRRSLASRLLCIQPQPFSPKDSGRSLNRASVQLIRLRLEFVAEIPPKLRFQHHPFLRFLPFLLI